jgi:ribosomal protein S18 acetylase RimI-like enzyme
MSSITYHSLTQVDPRAFCAAFNRAYRDYPVPIIMTPESLDRLAHSEDVDLRLSIAAMDHDQVIGMGMLGVRGNTGWIGGLGVIPHYRRQGIARAILNQLLTNARERALEYALLEVIESNDGAYALYRERGFQDLRKLLLLKRNPAPLPQRDQPYVIQTRLAADLLGYFGAFHSTPNPWQRGLPSLETMTAFLSGWAILDNSNIVGYGVGRADEHDIRILDIAAAPDSDRVAVGQALLRHLHTHYPRSQSTSFNIADDDPILPAFEALGYTTWLRQVEMRLALKR